MLIEACLSALCSSITCNHLSSGKKRKPAWTDRILWRLRPKASLPDEQDGNGAGLDVKQLKQLEEDEEYPLKIRQDSYTSIMEYGISDHKPVVSIFTLEVRIWFNTKCSTQCSYIIWVGHFCWLISLTHPYPPFWQSCHWLDYIFIGELNNACFVKRTNPVKSNSGLIVPTSIVSVSKAWYIFALCSGAPLLSKKPPKRLNRLEWVTLWGHVPSWTHTVQFILTQSPTNTCTATPISWESNWAFYKSESKYDLIHVFNENKCDGLASHLYGQFKKMIQINTSEPEILQSRKYKSRFDVNSIHFIVCPPEGTDSLISQL